MSVIGPLLRKSSVHALIIVLLGLLAYSNTLKAPFVFDDYGTIIDNPIVQRFLNFTAAPEAMPDTTDFMRRYVGNISFALNYKLHGTDETGYHLFNISVHLINALLVYWIVLLTFKTPYFPAAAPAEEYSGFPELTALFSALLFVAHPLQTQAVTYIAQRFSSLATLFYLTSLACYIVSRCADTMSRKYVFYGASLVSAVLAMKTKEIALTLPVVALLYEFMFFEGDRKKRLLYLLPLLLTMLVIPLSFMQGGSSLPGLITQLGQRTAETDTISRHDYLITQFRVIVTYLRLLFFPLDQNLDYDYPVCSSFFAPPVFLSFALLLALFALGVYALHLSGPQGRPDRHELRLAAFGIFYFFMTLSVESSIIPIRDVIFEHRVYLPSAGFMIAVIAGIMSTVRQMKKRGVSTGTYVVPLLALLVLVLAAAAYARNAVWQDRISLWSDVVHKSPKKARPHNNLGQAYAKQGLYEKAVEEYQTAVRLDPGYVQARSNLGFVLNNMGRLDEAISEYMAALRINPADAGVRAKLLFVLTKKTRARGRNVP